MSVLCGVEGIRISLDTIQLKGELYQYVVACTFIDVFAGCVPLIWKLNLSLVRNILHIALTAAALFAFNIFRLEIGQILHAYGVPWIAAHEILGGFAYFAVWLAIWNYNRRLFHNLPRSNHFPVKSK